MAIDLEEKCFENPISRGIRIPSDPYCGTRATSQMSECLFVDKAIGGKVSGNPSSKMGDSVGLPVEMYLPNIKRRGGTRSLALFGSGNSITWILMAKCL